MTENTTIVVRLAANGRIAIDTLVDDPDFKGVANTSYLDAAAAIRLGEGLVRLGRQSMRGEAVRVLLSSFKASTPGKVLPLAVPTDPHAGDGT